jgi:hypothetical protein
MKKEKRHIYGLELELDKELSTEDRARLNKVFEQTADAIAKLKLKEKPRVHYPVKPPISK